MIKFITAVVLSLFQLAFYVFWLFVSALLFASGVPKLLSDPADVFGWFLVIIGVANMVLAYQVNKGFTAGVVKELAKPDEK